MASFLRSSSRSKVTWPRQPAQLAVQSPSSLGNPETISLRTLIETRCPSVLTPFKPAWWLFNGHLQTWYASIGDFSQVDLVLYDRKLLQLKDGGTLGIDFAPSAKAGRVFAETTPVIVILHGLTGGSHEAYLRNIVAPAVAPVEEGGLGYRAVVVNSRGCAGVPLTSSQFYGLSHTDDFRQAMFYIAEKYPRAPLLGLGFSLGANLLARYAAEEGESCRLVSACALGSPWDVVKSSKNLEATWFSRLVYSKSLGTNLKNILVRHLDSIRQLPDTRLAQALPPVLAQSRLTGIHFDTLVTMHLGGSSPPFPFSDVQEYYAHASSHDKIHAIRIPLLALNAGDDPIAPWAPHGYDHNEWLTLVVTCGGGHMGWFQSGGLTDRWPKRPALEWFKATAEDVILGPRNVPAIEWKDGWLVETGKEHLGCREIGDGGTFQGATRKAGDLLAGL